MLKPQQPQGQPQGEPQNDLIAQLAERVGLPEDVVVSVLEVMLKRAKEGKPTVPPLVTVPTVPIVPPSARPVQDAIQYGASVEIGLAAGLDIPTAMALSERRQSSTRTIPDRSWAVLVLVMIVSLAWLCLRGW